MTRKTSWTAKDARTIYAKMVKVANDMVDATAAPQEEGGQAGPQEVVDALDVIVDELEAVQEAIPAETSEEEEEPTEEPEVEPTEEKPVEDPEKEELMAKLKSLEQYKNAQERKEVAQEFAELFPQPKIAQAKFDEVMSSKEPVETWRNKIAAIQEYNTNSGEGSYVRPAKNESKLFGPRTKLAKLSGIQTDELTHL